MIDDTTKANAMRNMGADAFGKIKFTDFKAYIDRDGEDCEDQNNRADCIT